MEAIVGGWLWDKYGKSLVDKAGGKAKELWKIINWEKSEELYRKRLREQHCYTRLLGNPKQIEIERIYTDVYYLDQITAYRRYSIEELQSRPLERDIFWLERDEARHPLLNLIKNEKRLYLLGRPGAGKTTFLRYLTLQACDDKIRNQKGNPLTPIFVELRDWSAKKIELIPYMVKQFDICAFPDAEAFIRCLLENGEALVLFDGLDEVNQEGDMRTEMVYTLRDFARQYPETHICLTCRIAASDYSFEQFRYLEIADFTDDQVRMFASKWYQGDEKKGKLFLKELEKPKHRGLKELTRTPMLLTLLCLAFDETMEIPANQTELFREAFDALLKKWDSSRGIKRQDETYQKLTPRRKEMLLARLAAENFEKGTYFIQDRVLVKQIDHYLRQLPDQGSQEELDGSAVLKAIAAHHGLLIERAHNIYSFSHLTIQEYLTARYIVENVSTGTLDRLIRQHLADDRWREVIVMVPSLLDDSGEFFEIFLRETGKLVLAEPMCLGLLKTANQIGRVTPSSVVPVIVVLACALALSFARDETIESDRAIGLARAIDQALSIARNRAIAHARTKDKDFDPARSIDQARDIDLALHLAIGLAHSRAHVRANEIIDKLRELLMKYYNMDIQPSRPDWDIKQSLEQIKCISDYLKANSLLIRCLSLAAVPDRASIQGRMFLPPEE